MGHVPQYVNHTTTEGDIKVTLGERSSDHSLIAKGEIPVPAPFQDREVVS